MIEKIQARMRRTSTLGLALLLLAVVWGRLPFQAARGQEADPAKALTDDRADFDLSKVKKVAVIPIEGMIDEVTDAFVRRSVESAKAQGADFIVFEMHTWGGRVDSAQGICKSINGFDPLPSAMLVEQSAISAGALIALANNYIFMNREATIGDAQPVIGDEPSSEEKYVSFIRAEFQSQAEANGHNPYLAMKMVDANIVLWKVEVAGQTRIIDDVEKMQLEDAQRLDEEGIKIIGRYLDSGRLLVLTSKEAMELGLIQGVASSRQELYEQLGIASPEEFHIQMTWSEDFAKWLTNPWLVGILMTIAMIGIYIEFQAPGVGLPGGVAVTCLIIVFFGKYIAGLATIIDLLLLLCGLGLLAAELFVIPGFGVAGFLGILLTGAGILLSMQKFVLPENPIESDVFAANITFTLGILTASLVAGMSLMRFMHRIPGARRLMLQGNISTEQGYTAVRDMSRWLHRRGVAETPLRPAGKVRVDGELLDAVSQGDLIDKGAEIEICKIDGNRLVVKQAKA